MYKITVKHHFSSAHFLRGYKGRCENLHGHNWIVEAILGGEKLDSTGMLFDFSSLKKSLIKILDEIDHTILNEHPEFKKENPSAERIAKFVFDKLSKTIRKKGIQVVSVRVHENDSSCAEYAPDE